MWGGLALVFSLVFLQSSSSSSSFFPSCARSGAWLSCAFEAIVLLCGLPKPNKTKAGAPRLLEAFPPLGHSAVPSFLAWIAIPRFGRPFRKP